MGPGPPPQGGPRPQTTRVNPDSRPSVLASKLMLILMSIFFRLGVDLGPLWGVIFGHVGASFGPSWPRNRLRTVLSLKKLFFTKHVKINRFRRFNAQDGGRRRPKIAPRRVQDRLGPFFFLLLNVCFDLGSLVVPFWCRFGLPNGAPGLRSNYGLEGPWGSKTVLKSSWFGSLVVLSLGIAFLLVLGSFWGNLGRSGSRFGAFSAFQLIDSTYQLVNSSIQTINSSTHQLIDSTHQPINSIPKVDELSTTRPGRLRAARLNKS